MLAHHFDGVIHNILSNKWVHYGHITHTVGFKSVPPLNQCDSLMVSTTMPRLYLEEGDLLQRFDGMISRTARLIHCQNPFGNGERHIWGLSALDWKQEEDALVVGDDPDEEESGEMEDMEEDVDDQDSCSLPLSAPINLEELNDTADDPYVYYGEYAPRRHKRRRDGATAQPQHR